MPSTIEPPSPGDTAHFQPGFGQRFLVTVDAEEEFDWSAPLAREGHGLTHVAKMERFQAFCEGYGVTPTYLVDWPIANCPQAIAILGKAVADGKAEIGAQLHPWVNPPFDEKITAQNSFAGNLPEQLERAKLDSLCQAITRNFGHAPLIYRAGRYGVGPNTTRLLIERGFAIDSSVRSNFDYSNEGGRDFNAHPLAPYWTNAERSLLELPLTTSFWGILRRQGPWIYPRLWRMPQARGLLARLGLLERIPLTPEGVSVEETIRGIDMALDDGLPLLVFSFHSPSLDIGHTPYVRDAADLDQLYGWWERIFTYLAQRQIRPASIAGILQAVAR